MDLKLLDTFQPTVLIVEPSRHFASLLRHILSVGGVRDVEYAADAYGALEVIKGAHVDMAIVDSELAGITALELTNVIRRASDSPNQALPIILLSDRPTRRLIDNALLAGIDCYVRKPVSADTLLQRIKWCLEKGVAPEDALSAEHATVLGDEFMLDDGVDTLAI